MTYDATTGLLAVELLDGEKLTLPVFDDFGLTVTASDNETFRLGETRAFEVVQNNVAEAVIDAPAGWTAVLGETTLTVKAPATFDAASQQAAVSVTVYSDRKYRKLVTLNVTLLDEQVDANAALAWRNFKAGTADNVLLDYSYAGYKHGEEAPADVWGLGYKVYNVVDYGADPTGVRSSRGALAALLKELKLSGRSDAGANLANANARAVIYFPEGRFVLHNDDDNVVDPTSANQKYTDSKGNNRSEEIFIRGGYFVLKGAGRGKTTLVMDTPNLPNNSEQMWSSPMMINIKHNSGLSDLTTVTGDAARGTFSVEVASAAGIGKGDWVCLSLSNNDPTLVAQELAPHRVEGNMTDIQTITVEDYHQVASVSGNRVTFAEPIMYAVEAKWGWKIRKYPHYEHGRCRGPHVRGPLEGELRPPRFVGGRRGLQAAQHDASDRFVDSPRRFQGRQRGVVDRVERQLLGLRHRDQRQPWPLGRALAVLVAHLHRQGLRPQPAGRLSRRPIRARGISKTPDSTTPRVCRTPRWGPCCGTTRGVTTPSSSRIPGSRAPRSSTAARADSCNGVSAATKPTCPTTWAT